MYKVFIVDDERFILDGLRAVINWEILGMEIVGQAENGKEAFAQLQDMSVDLLITDISMPLMDGLELIRAVVEIKPDIKVIVLSGYDEFKFIKEGLSLGIENYLLKPINIAEFQSSIETILEKLNAARINAEWVSYTTSVLKDNVLLRWMRNQIDQGELSERLRLLDLAINKRFIQVAIIRAGQWTEGFYSLTVTLTERFPTLSTFWNMNNDFVLLHNFEDSVRGAAELKRILEELLACASTDSEPRTSVGKIEERKCEVHFSYEQAVQGQEFLAIHPERRIIFFEELDMHVRDLKDYLPEDWHDYTKLILSKDRNAVLDKLKVYFQQEQMNSLTPEKLGEVAAEWILYFRLLIKDVRDGKEQESIQDTLINIRTAQSLPELLISLKLSINKIMDLYEREVKSPIVNQAIDYIEKFYKENLSLKKLASELHIHPVYLGQLFHKSQGEPFADYLNRFRIERSKVLLQTTSLKVQEIANEVGYWDMSYFYKQFKKFVGITPSQFKVLP